MLDNDKMYTIMTHFVNFIVKFNAFNIVVLYYSEPHHIVVIVELFLIQYVDHSIYLEMD